MKILLEGIKCTGKSTISTLLTERRRGFTVIEYRAYFNKAISKYHIHDDCLSRLNIMADLAHKIYDDDLLLLRGHLFPFALSEATGQNILPKNDFYQIDTAFSKSIDLLVMLTTTKEVFSERNIMRENENRRVDAIDKDFEFMNKMQEAYLRYFKDSCLKKVLIDTSTSNQTQVCEQIMEGFGEY